MALAEGPRERRRGLRIRAACTTDLPAIEALLRDAGLPAQDCGAHLANFFVAAERGHLIGTGGLEVCGRHGLARSLAVAPAARGRGAGDRLLNAVEGRARRLGMDGLYLLTETAGGFFEKHGYVTIARAAAPPEIAATREFRELCPASAVLMWGTPAVVRRRRAPRENTP